MLGHGVALSMNYAAFCVLRLTANVRFRLRNNAQVESVDFAPRRYLSHGAALQAGADPALGA